MGYIHEQLFLFQGGIVLKKVVELDEMPKDFIIIEKDLIIIGTGLKYQQGDEHHERILPKAQ